MAIQGNLKSVRVPELISFIHQLRKTGVLTILSNQEERGFVFHAGQFVYATSKDTARRLGSFLVRVGIITGDDLEREAEKETGADVYLGQRLVDSGCVSKQQLNHAVEAQVLDILEEVLGWTTGAFHFDDNELPFKIPEGGLISATAILFEATRRADEKSFVSKLFPDTNLVLAPAAAESSSNLAGDAARALSFVDGKRSVEQILFACPLDDRRTAAALHSLVEDGTLRQAGVQVLNLEKPVPELECSPVAPHAAGTLFTIFNSEDSQFPALCEVVAQDPLLTVKILKSLTLRNAVIPRGSLDIAHLLSLLGTFKLRSILVPEALHALFFPRADSLWKECWEHSLACARLCRRVAAQIGHLYPEEAYMAGLVHNLGAYILMSTAPKKYRSAVEEAVNSRRDLQEIEEECFGISHTRVGGIYAEKWHFPRTLALVIKNHHQVDLNSPPLLDIVSVALGLLDEQGMGFEYATTAASHLHASLKRLHLKRRKALALLE